MSLTMHQLQGLRHSLCSSNSFNNKEKLNKCSASANVRVHRDDSISKQDLKFRENHQFGGHASKSPKQTVEFSYMPKAFEVNSLAANGSLPYVPEKNKIIGANEQVESSESPGSKVEIHKREWDRVWEVVSGYFLTLDATLKIIMLIFIPCYVAVRVIYGIEVLKELTPLWVLGPLIVAFDIKMFQAISQLYVFSFKQTEKAIRSIPSPKKLTEATYTILQKIVNVKSFDYKNVVKLKLKEIVRWNENISVFFSTRSWPLYWRVVRFLTRANLI